MNGRRWALVVGAPRAAFGSTWTWYLARLRDGADEKLGLVALLLVAVLAFLRRTAAPLPPPLLALAGLVALYAGLGWLGAPALIRAVPALTAVALLLSAAAHSRRLHTGTAALLLLGLPLESTLQFYLGYPLRIAATFLATGLLRAAGIAVSSSGTLIAWRGEAIGVDAPCSGIHMLWVGLLLAGALAALLDLGPVRTAVAAILALATVVLGNGLRVALLFVKEAGLITLPDWTHEAVGALVFGLAMLPLAEWARRLRGSPVAPRTPRVPGDLALASYVVAGSLCALLPLLPGSPRVEVPEGFPGWPTTLDGAPLTPLLARTADERFGLGFPGRFARFQDGSRSILLRWLPEPTRRLHSSSDCFRGAGYATRPRPSRVDARGRRWGCFEAARGAQALDVCERIFDESGRSWTDPSSWWWAATLGRSQGPYWAVTVVARSGEPPESD